MEVWQDYFGGGMAFPFRILTGGLLYLDPLVKLSSDGGNPYHNEFVKRTL